MTDFLSSPVSRRTAFKAGAAAAGIFASGGLILGTASRASAALPTILPLSGTKYQFYKNVASAVPGARMQSFAFDSVNKKLFTATRADGSSGDIEIRRVLVGSGSEGNNSSQRMIIAGAGHGVAIGVEPIGGESYIWVETDKGSDGFGTSLSRFRFEAGRNTGNSGEAGFGAFDGDRKLFGGSVQISCSVDHVFDYGDGKARLAVYRRTPSQPDLRIEVYQLNGVSGPPTLEWAARVNAMRDSAGNGQGSLFQGFAFYANRFYATTGSHGADNIYLHMQTPEEPKSTDWVNSPKMVAATSVKQSTNGISDAEPEGIAVYRPDSSETVRLNWGIASDGTPRKNSMYYRTA